MVATSSAFTLDIERRDGQPGWLGRHKVHDSRSREFDVVADLPEGLTTAVRGARRPRMPERDVTHRRYVPAFDQGDIGCCTVCAGIGAVCAEPFPNALRPTVKGMILPLYSELTRLDNAQVPGSWPPEDTGSSGLWAAKMLRSHGYINRWSQAFTFEAAMAALALAPISVGVWWYDSMEQTDPGGHLRISAGAQQIGGHQVCAIGRDVAGKRTRFVQSWGPDWGDGGQFWLDDDTLRGLLDDGGDVTCMSR